MNFLSRYFHTVRYLKLQQVVYQVRHRFAWRALATQPDFVPRPRALKILPGPQRPESHFGKGRFLFLNQTVDLGWPIDWRATSLPKLWQYNLHYFDFLQQPGMNRETGLELMRGWMADHPPAPGAVGWEPYPLSLRLVNWLKFLARNAEFPPDISRSLSLQGLNLERQVEYHILGNHLFANGKALWWAGRFLGNEEWVKKGKGIILSELPEQFLPEGGHFELSPMYHSLMLEDLLDLINLGQVEENQQKDEQAQGALRTVHPEDVGWALVRRRLLPRPVGRGKGWGEGKPWRVDGPPLPVPLLPSREEREKPLTTSGCTALRKVAAKALFWLQQMADDQGRIPLLNDSVEGIAPPAAALREYAGNLGVKPDAREAPSVALGSWTGTNLSGYWVLRKGPFRLVFDTALLGPDYLPGHAHCDMLSILLEFEGASVFTDTGVFEYAEGAPRTYSRSTRAHNTVSVDGLDQADLWKSFRMGKRGRPREFSRKGNELSCSHDGFAQQRAGIVHQRAVVLHDDGFEILDRLQGPGRHRYESFFHCAPGTKIQQQGKEFLINDRLMIRVGGSEAVCESSSYFPEFGRKVERPCLALRGEFEKEAVVSLKCTCSS